MTNPIRITNNNLNPQNPSGLKIQKSSTQIDFAEALTKKTEEQAIRFSNHAQKRLQSRAIQLGDDGLARLAQAVEKADKRGGKESLVLMDDLAFIVNVKERLVVTAIDSNERGEGVFTQIDSVVLADK